MQSFFNLPIQQHHLSLFVCEKCVCTYSICLSSSVSLWFIETWDFFENTFVTIS